MATVRPCYHRWRNEENSDRSTVCRRLVFRRGHLTPSFTLYTCMSTALLPLFSAAVNDCLQCSTAVLTWSYTDPVSVGSDRLHDCLDAYQSTAIWLPALFWSRRKWLQERVWCFIDRLEIFCPSIDGKTMTIVRMITGKNQKSVLHWVPL